jgi:hypothetical protein
VSNITVYRNLKKQKYIYKTYIKKIKLRVEVEGKEGRRG